MPTDSKPKFPYMINKLFSFFQSKHKYIQNNPAPQDNLASPDVIAYQNLKAEDIMIPRADIVALDYNDNLNDISKIFLETRHTRMPVYKKTLDNIIGFINIKDIFPFILNPQDHPKFEIDKVLRKLLIISPSMKIFALLEKMRQTRTHISLVVDELGGADGLITIEDLVEKFIGKIEDEHDQIETDLEFKEIDPEHFEANGRIKIEDLEEKLSIQLNEEDHEKYDTIGGLILSISGYVPEKGTKITHPSTGLIFEVLDSDPRRIKKVLIFRPNS